MGFIITCKLHLISRALLLYLTGALSSFYWKVPWRPCARKEMQSTKPFTWYAQAHFYSKMEQMPFTLPHIPASDNLRKAVWNESNQKKGLFWMISQCNQLSPLSTRCADLFFNFLSFLFFLTTSLALQGVNGQLFAFSWGNALLTELMYSHPSFKASEFRAEESLTFLVTVSHSLLIISYNYKIIKVRKDI